MRTHKVYEPEDRQWIEDNLYCPYCGNTTQWQFDIRLRHVIECDANAVALVIDPKKSQKLIQAITSDIHRNLHEHRFQCANCHNDEINYQMYYLESCWYNGCPGCFHCGQWIDRDLVIDLCEDCINKHHGNVNEELCCELCEHYEFGLGEVRAHYDISLEELKRNLGYL